MGSKKKQSPDRNRQKETFRLVRAAAERQDSGELATILNGVGVQVWRTILEHMDRWTENAKGFSTVGAKFLRTAIDKKLEDWKFERRQRGDAVVRSTVPGFGQEMGLGLDFGLDPNTEEIMPRFAINQLRGIERKVTSLGWHQLITRRFESVVSETPIGFKFDQFGVPRFNIVVFTDQVDGKRRLAINVLAGSDQFYTRPDKQLEENLIGLSGAGESGGGLPRMENVKFELGDLRKAVELCDEMVAYGCLSAPEPMEDHKFETRIDGFKWGADIDPCNLPENGFIGAVSGTYVTVQIKRKKPEPGNADEVYDEHSDEFFLGLAWTPHALDEELMRLVPACGFPTLSAAVQMAHRIAYAVNNGGLCSFAGANFHTEEWDRSSMLACFFRRPLGPHSAEKGGIISRILTPDAPDNPRYVTSFMLDTHGQHTDDSSFPAVFLSRAATHSNVHTRTVGGLQALMPEEPVIGSEAALGISRKLDEGMDCIAMDLDEREMHVATEFESKRAAAAKLASAQKGTQSYLAERGEWGTDDRNEFDYQEFDFLVAELDAMRDSAAHGFAIELEGSQWKVPRARYGWRRDMREWAEAHGLIKKKVHRGSDYIGFTKKGEALARLLIDRIQREQDRRSSNSGSGAGIMTMAEG